MSVNNKILITISALTVVIIICLGIFTVAEPKKSYEGVASIPITEYKININTADVAEFTRCSGIGEKTAQKIVDYRNENGTFNSIDELLNIEGIGEMKLNEWKKYLCAE